MDYENLNEETTLRHIIDGFADTGINFQFGEKWYVIRSNETDRDKYLKEQKEEQENNMKLAEQSAIKDFKQKSRIESLRQAATRLPNPESKELYLTASERIGEAEIIYKWLIKDL